MDRLYELRGILSEMAKKPSCCCGRGEWCDACIPINGYGDTVAGLKVKKAQAALDIVESMIRDNPNKHPETKPIYDREGNYVGEWNGKIVSGPQYSTQHPSIEMKIDGVVGNGTGRCHLCLKILDKNEMKPGGVHYCPGTVSTQNTEKPVHVITSNGCSICGTDAINCEVLKSLKSTKASDI